MTTGTTIPQKVQLRAIATFTSPIEGRVRQHQFLWVPPERVAQLVEVVKCCVRVERKRAAGKA